MSTPNYEPDDLISALREDLPSDADEHRARTRLLATGAALGGATVAHHLVSHITELKGTATLASKLSAAFCKSAALVEGAANGIGLSATVASWGAGTKSVIAVAAVAVAAGVPVAEHLRAVERTSVSTNPPEVTARQQDEPSRPSLAAVGPPRERSADDLNQTEPLQTARRIVSEPAAPPKLAKIATAPTRPQSARIALEVAAPAAHAELSPMLTQTDERVKSPPAMVQTPEATQIQPARTLQAETHLLEQALAALGQSNNAQASRLLDEHQRRFPNGLLAPERLRLRARISEQGSKNSTQ